MCSYRSILLLLVTLVWVGRTSALAESTVASASAAVPLTRDTFVAALARDLSTHFNLEGDLQLELLRPWSPPVHSAASWEVAILEYPSAPSASMLLRIRISADGKIVTTAVDSSLVVRGALWRDAWVARQPLTVGATFDPAVLEARRVDLFRDRDVLPSAAGDRSFIFARAVSAGRLLTWRDIVRRPLVKKGELVEVSATSGLLIIKMKALAMESGGQGETITIRNPESQKNFAATVVDENRVQVRF
jgi:flagella basal body P-ring formation protein FlgA